MKSQTRSTTPFLSVIEASSFVALEPRITTSLKGMLCGSGIALKIYRAGSHPKGVIQLTLNRGEDDHESIAVADRALWRDRNHRYRFKSKRKCDGTEHWDSCAECGASGSS